MSIAFNKATTITKESELDFGKYNGCVVEDILREDPDYIAWCISETDKFFSRDIIKEIVSYLRLRISLLTKKEKPKYKSKYRDENFNIYSDMDTYFDDDIPF